VIFPARRCSAKLPGFTILELMIVVGIIVLSLAFLLPAIMPATGRSIEGAMRQFTSDLENARQLAIAERTKTRVLVPDKNPGSGAFGSELSDLALRGYTTVSFNKTANTWKQRGKWTRLAQPATFDPKPTVSGTEEGVIEKHKTDQTKVDNSNTGSAATKTFTGAYIEFLPNGSTSLDPASPLQIMAVADGIPDGNGNMTPKNKSLYYRITIDPLTGSVRLK
jgi:type II secretory pathway pseudopilin PulG